MKYTITMEAELTVKQLAEIFCSLTDEQQADFFENVGRIGSGWHTQWWNVGNHMKTCGCVTDSGRQIIELIHDAMVCDSKTGEYMGALGVSPTIGQ